MKMKIKKASIPLMARFRQSLRLNFNNKSVHSVKIMNNITNLLLIRYDKAISALDTWNFWLLSIERHNVRRREIFKTSPIFGRYFEINLNENVGNLSLSKQIFYNGRDIIL